MTPPLALDAPEIRHKTLSAYHPKLQTLLNYLIEWRPSLLLETDPVEYREFLTKTICAPEPSKPIAYTSEKTLYGTQQELIDRILGELSKQRIGKDGRNVLISSSKYVDHTLPINANRPTVETRHVNTPSSALRSLVWKILRSRIGDSAFRHLLLYTSIYLPVGNSCYLQLSGTPLYDLYDHHAQTAGPRIVEKRKRYREDGSIRKKQKTGVEPPGGAAQGEKRKRPGEELDRNPLARTNDILIPRGKIFYGQPSRKHDGKLIIGLPPHHILNLLHQSDHIPTDTACLSLLHEIFPSMFRSTPTSAAGRGVVGGSNAKKRKLDIVAEGLRFKGSHVRVQGMIGMMREILARHALIDYRKLLWRCLDRRGDVEEELLPMSHSQVYRFVSAVVKALISTTFIGGQHNLTTLLQHIRSFINAKQYELCSLHQLMQGMRVNDISWLRAQQTPGNRINGQEHTKCQALLQELMKWLFENYLIPLLKNTFYITETAFTRYETVYYTHDDWSRATKPHFESLQDELLEELDSNQRFFAEQGPLGVSAVRLIHKPNGFRPIVNLGRRLKTKQASIIGNTNTIPGKPVTANHLLRGVHRVLTFEKERKKHLMGSSLFGTNEIFAPLRELKQDLLAKHGKMPRLYFVKMDIKAAFDTIKQKKMLQIVADLLDKHEDYSLMLYSLLLPPASKASQGSSRRLFKTRALIKDDLSTNFDSQAKSIASNLRNAVVVDLVRRKTITKDSCLELLKTHIAENVWQIGGKLFRQKRGIPQGSKISSLLCSFFYACLEREHLGFVRQNGSRMLRYIDDFLFISDDYHLAKRFVQTMNQGFPEYGAFVSPSKTLLSFEYATGSQVAPVVGLQGMGDAFFPYCGFFIDMRTLDLSMDYPRMLTGPIRQSFSLRNHQRQGAGFVGWLSRQLENRNHIAYLDTCHNDLDTIYMNVFLNFALTGMKIPHYFDCHIDFSVGQNQRILDSLLLSVEYTFIAGRARVLHAARESSCQEGHYRIKKGVFKFIALSALHKVLSQKVNRFKGIVDELMRHLHKREYRGMDETFKQILESSWNRVKDAEY